MSLIDEQNRRLADLERTRSSVRLRRSPSPTPNRRGESSRPSRSRSPGSLLVLDLPATEGDPPEGDHQDGPLLEDPHHRDLHQDAIDALGPHPVPKTPEM